MSQRNPNEQYNPREIPNRENPDKSYPEQAPNREPNQDKPNNPNEKR